MAAELPAETAPVKESASGWVAPHWNALALHGGGFHRERYGITPTSRTRPQRDPRNERYTPILRISISSDHRDRHRATRTVDRDRRPGGDPRAERRSRRPATPH